MDAQPKSRASVNRKRNAELLRQLLADSEQLLRQQARKHAELPEDAEDALQSAYVRRELLATLKPDERRALGMFGAGLSYAEICQATGWTHTKVNRCLAEGRAELRKRLVGRGG